MEDILIGLKTIANTLGTGIRTVRKWIYKEGLPAVKYSDGIYRISKQCLLAWIAQKEKQSLYSLSKKREYTSRM